MSFEFWVSSELKTRPSKLKTGHYKRRISCFPFTSFGEIGYLSVQNGHSIVEIFFSKLGCYLCTKDSSNTTNYNFKCFQNDLTYLQNIFFILQLPCKLPITKWKNRDINSSRHLITRHSGKTNTIAFFNKLMNHDESFGNKNIDHLLLLGNKNIDHLLIFENKNIDHLLISENKNLIVSCKFS